MQENFMAIKKADINIHNFGHHIKTESQKNLIEDTFFSTRSRDLDKTQKIK